MGYGTSADLWTMGCYNVMGFIGNMVRGGPKTMGYKDLWVRRTMGYLEFDCTSQASLSESQMLTRSQASTRKSPQTTPKDTGAQSLQLGDEFECLTVVDVWGGTRTQDGLGILLQYDVTLRVGEHREGLQGEEFEQKSEIVRHLRYVELTDSLRKHGKDGNSANSRRRDGLRATCNSYRLSRRRSGIHRSAPTKENVSRNWKLDTVCSFSEETSMAVTGESTIHRLRKLGKRHKFDTPSCVKWACLEEMVWTPVKRTRESKNAWCDFSGGKSLHGTVCHTACGEMEAAATKFKGIRMEIKFGKKKQTRYEAEEVVGPGNLCKSIR
ncbi:hypothetical protein C8R44DRAFT_723516 [Mycena epipterygia]|nr:hypothetical protein C8R44DRAFT_723516 [Mycena epipterygia]